MENAKQRNINGKRRGNIANLAPPWPKGVSGNPKGRPRRTPLVVPPILTRLRKQIAEMLANYDQLTPTNQQLARRWAAVLLYVTDAPGYLATSAPSIRDQLLACADSDLHQWVEIFGARHTGSSAEKPRENSSRPDRCHTGAVGSD